MNWNCVETVVHRTWLGHNGGIQPFHAKLMIDGCVPMTEGSGNGFSFHNHILEKSNKSSIGFQRRSNVTHDAKKMN